MRNIKISIAVCTLTAILASGCSTTIDSLPLPAPGVGGDSYTVKAVFVNALNLPIKAKVRINGADVGEVESMTASNYTATVDLDISNDVQIPVGTKAELRSATPIGDVFVILVPPIDASTDTPSLGDGDTIPIENTSAASTIEDLLTKASLVVNGGAIRNLTTVVNGLGRDVGDRGERVGDLIEHTRQMLSALNARSADMRNAIDQTSDLSALLTRDQDTIDAAIGAAAPALTTIGDNTTTMVQLVQQLDAITTQLDEFPSINGTGGRSLIADIDTLAAGMNAASIDPESDLSSPNGVFPVVMKITNSQTSHVNVDIAQLALGAVPDPNYPGTPEARVPDSRDWINFVGSLTYTLNRLKDRVIGPGQ